MAAPPSDADFALGDSTYAPPPSPTIVRPAENPFSSDMKFDVQKQLQEQINAGWRNWEMAVAFKDDTLADYYMRMIHLLLDTLKKLKKL